MKRHMWIALMVVGISGTSWGAMIVTSSGGSIGVMGGQTVGHVVLPGTCGGNFGVHIGMLPTMMDYSGFAICGNNTLCGGDSDPCGGNDPQPPSCKPDCWPRWPVWRWPWCGVETSSSSTSIAIASGPGSSATAETSGISTAPGSSSSSYSYAHSVNP